MESSAIKPGLNIPEFLQGGGEMGERIRTYNWADTSLGPVETWPQSLRTCVRIMLTSRQPIWIGWGKELIKLYNDPYIAIAGGKHPWALGVPASVVWKDIWRNIEPMLQQVMEKNEGTYVESQLLIMERNGYPEETYYTFSYTPIPGSDSGTAGMICANTDDTDKIISERQLRTLTRLGKNLTDSKSNVEVIEKTIATLDDNLYDFPFTLFYTVTDNAAILSHASDECKTIREIPKEIDMHADNEMTSLIKQCLHTKKPQVFENLQKKIGIMPKGAWEVAPDKAILLPIVQGGAKEPFGFLVIGLNPYRLLDEKYSGFFSLIADQVATSFANVHVLEAERKRAEALAEIDRAKTTFFSNISHEFRTPLTLLLGPIEEALNDPKTTEHNRVRMDMAYRNGLRMQKLVNTLLEFSRIEAGRLDGKFMRVDIAALTKDLGSTFRSAIEKAGMELQINGDEIKDTVYVDVDMWERIILNLVSNAFKYSREGKISIDIRQRGNNVEVSVADTGIGIPDEHLDKIFDRFHRVENMEGRSQEGTGIGLALVKELVKAHNGAITVASEPGKGSTFTVSIPVGKDHLPAGKIIDQDYHGNIPVHSDAFVKEALKWLPDGAGENSTTTDEADPGIANSNGIEKKYTVLLADDNADMQSYAKRLLAGQFNVITANDGEAAFEKVLQYKPDLLLTDIMMPKLDGFGLLNKIRNHPDTRHLPVIFLSARAGEEAKVEGLDAGADDYLVKPFSAKELLARTEANIKINVARRNMERELSSFLMQAPFGIMVLRGANYIIELANDLYLPVVNKKREDLIGKSLFKSIPEHIAGNYKKLLDNIRITGIPVVVKEQEIWLCRDGYSQPAYLNIVYQPVKDLAGHVTQIMVVVDEVTEQVIARREMEHSRKELNELANAMAQLVWISEADGKIIYFNNRIEEFDPSVQAGKDWENLIHPDDKAATESEWNNAVKERRPMQIEHRLKMKDGSYRWHLSRSIPQKNEQGDLTKWFGTATDVHAAKKQSEILEDEVRKRTYELQQLNVSLQQSNSDLQQFAHVASHDLKEPLRKIKIFTGRLKDDSENILSDRGALYIDKVNSATDRMFSMIEGVLSYSTINAMEQLAEPVLLNDVIENIETDLEVLIQEKSAHLVYDHLPVIEGAPILIYQLFYNLINNSLKFSRKGQECIIEISASYIEKDRRAYTIIKLKDNGIGFEQKEAERIFNPFARLNSKDYYEGTGLGLSLCKKIVLRHGGSIEAMGEKGEGATFVIILPLKQEREHV